MMQADIHVIVNAPSKPHGSTAVTPGQTITFKTPAALAEAAFPTNETVTFPIDNNSANTSGSELYSSQLKEVGAQFCAASQARNAVIYAYGQQGTPKRQAMFTPDSGYAEKVLQDVMKSKPSAATLYMSCYILGSSENLVDCLNADNSQGIIVDSVKEGPRVKHIERVKITSASDVSRSIKTIHKAIEAHFAEVNRDHYDTLEAQALPPYNPDAVVLQLTRYNDEAALDAGIENNSLHFVALGDSERPPLCGVDPLQLQQYEKNQKVLGSVVGVMQAIRNNRLRIPYGKSKLTLLLKRAYNGEKNNANNALNAPTRSLLLVHVFNDDGHAEESFHALTMSRRVANVMSGNALGPVTRDLSVEKWRLEQDILELKDELTIAKQVHDYRPCIYDQAKPVQNIAEEENKRITAIVKKREEAKEKQLAEVRAKAQEEAKRIIDEEERKNGMTLAALEKAVDTKRAENASLQSERAKKVKEYEKHLEKLRKKKDEEEAALNKLRSEIKTLEEDLATRQTTVEKKRRQLEMTSQDQARGREAILKEREEVKAQRVKLLEERRKQREQWIMQIRETNEKVLSQVQLLARERRARQQKEGVVQQEADPAEETEEQVREDIESIDRYLPKLISLEDNPADMEATESIRKQLEEYFAQERETYLRKLEEEKARRSKLEKAVEEFRAKLQESQSKVLKDQVGEAMRKEQHLQSLVDQVLQYLCNGLKMCKVSSQGNVRRRFFFLSEDFKKIHACEIDDIGMPIARRRPTVTVFLKDIKQVVLGCYTPSFTAFAGESNLSRGRAEAMRNDGSYNPEATQPLSKTNLGRYNYRSFAFFLRGGKTLELVCDTDSDCEAWVLALKRLLNYKTPTEIENERRQKRRDGQTYTPPVCLAPITWGMNFDITCRDGASQLSPDEVAVCSEQHIPPQLFLRIKREIQEKAQSTIITVYDIRVAYALDLIRSQALYEYFLSINMFPAPTHVNS